MSSKRKMFHLIALLTIASSPFLFCMEKTNKNKSESNIIFNKSIINVDNNKVNFIKEASFIQKPSFHRENHNPKIRKWAVSKIILYPLNDENKNTEPINIPGTSILSGSLYKSIPHSSKEFLIIHYNNNYYFHRLLNQNNEHLGICVEIQHENYSKQFTQNGTPLPENKFLAHNVKHNPELLNKLKKCTNFTQSNLDACNKALES